MLSFCSFHSAISRSRSWGSQVWLRHIQTGRINIFLYDFRTVYGFSSVALQISSSLVADRSKNDICVSVMVSWIHLVHIVIVQYAYVASYCTFFLGSRIESIPIISLWIADHDAGSPAQTLCGCCGSYIETCMDLGWSEGESLWTCYAILVFGAFSIILHMDKLEPVRCFLTIPLVGENRDPKHGSTFSRAVMDEML